MKTLFSRIILALSVLGFASAASAADLNYPQSGPIFSESAYLVGGVNEVDTFYFYNSTAGNYHFYSTGSVDTYGTVYSDTYASILSQNDDSGYSLNFCVDAYLLAGENITVLVEGYSNSSEGSYTVVGAAGTCASNPASDAAPASEVSAFSLPVVLFSLLGLAAVRLRRFFA